MKTIVITGSTRGIGYGLADSFLALGCNVVISGRAPTSVEKAVAALSAKHKPENVLGLACDVTQYAQMQALWDAAIARFGAVEIWINNAGQSTPQAKPWEYTPDQTRAVIETNLIGVMHGIKVAVNAMLKQGHGSIYNLEGLGSDGMHIAGLSLYGTTKYGLRYLTDALIQETKGTPLMVGAIRPGMVATNLITGQYAGRPEEWKRIKRLFNILSERVEVVTPWIARKILANTRTGRRIVYGGPAKMFWRFLTAPFSRRDVFGEQTPGN